MLEISCRVCKDNLNENNWYISHRNNYNYICMRCSKIQNDKIRWKNGQVKRIEINRCMWCDITLTDNNWYISRKIKKDHICNDCYKKRQHEYYKKYKTEFMEYGKQYYKQNKIKILIDISQWIKTPNGKESRKKTSCKRRNLKFIPLNNPLKEKCEPHHLDKEYVLYIPYKLHHSIYHNVHTGYNMNIINDRVFKWYVKYYKLI